MKFFEKLGNKIRFAEEQEKNKVLINKVIDDKGFYALDTKLQNELLKLRQGKCKSCKCSK